MFVVPGEPRSKGRPRFAKNGRTYTPAATREAEKEIEQAWRIATTGPTGTRMVHGRLGVEIGFVCKHRRKRDLDNMVKLVLDALNGVAYVDDESIDLMTVQRMWTTGEPETRVMIWRISE